MTEKNNESKKEIVKYVICPFCGGTDFDLIGLKLHLNIYCDIYQKIKIFNIRN